MEFEKTKCRRIKSNLLMQDLYLRDIVVPKDIHTEYGAPQYFELQQKPLEHGIGIQETLVPVDYPISPENVKSQASGCDYKVDPNAAIARSVSRKNLGDITSMQELLQMDTADAMRLYKDLGDKIIAAQQAKLDSEVKKVEEGEENVK